MKQSTTNPTSPLEIIALEPHHHPRACVVLARAFQDDPMTRFLMPDDIKRAQTLPWFLGTVVSYCRRYGEVYTTPKIEGVACWLPPGNTTVTSARIFRSGGVPTPLRLGPTGFRRLLAWQALLEHEHHTHAPEPHYYLYLLGVEPLARGQGLGRKLLEPVRQRADSEGKRCYLETNNHHNVAIYASLGFTLKGESQVPGYDLTVWAMCREAR